MLLASNRGPAMLALASLIVLVAQHVLVRAMAHGHVAHVLLGAGNAPPPADAAALAVGLVVVRLLAVLLVPGLLLAAAAEIAASLPSQAVSPKHADGIVNEADK